MAQPQVVILTSGGLRSLVATASALTTTPKARVALLHVRDGRRNGSIRWQHVQQQAHHFQIANVVDLDLPHLQAGVAPDEPAAWAPLARPQLMLVGLSQAASLGAQKLVWPASFNGDYPLLAQTTEQLVLLQHAAELERPQLPRIEAPLMELTDRQIVELGGHLDAPWDLAWSCALAGDAPCRVCPSCRRRHAAFHEAGMTDPVQAGAA